MLNEWITNLNEFINICMQVDVKLTELNIRSVVKASATQAARSVISTSITRLTSSVSSWKKLDWSRQVESSRSSRVFDSSRLDSSQNFEIEYSSRVRILISSIWVESWCWYRILIQILDSTRQDMIYYY